jgi:PAS domain S-box-containing protein
MTRIPDAIAPPNDMVVRRFVRGLDVIVGLAVIVAAVGVILAPVHFYSRVVVMVIGFATVALSEWHLRHNPQRSLLVLALGFWLLTAVNDIFLAGVHSSANVIFPFVVALVGWVMGGRWLIGVTAASVIFLIILAFLETVGLFIPTERATAVTVGSTLVSVIPVMAYLTYAAKKMLTESRDRAVVLSEEIANKHAQLQLREQELNTVVESVPAAVASFDAESRLRGCNRQYASLYAAEPEALKGKRIQDYAPDVVIDQVNAYSPPDAEEKPRSYRRFHVHPVTHEVRWLDVGVTPEIKDGKITGKYAILVDVTDKVQADAETQNQNVELERRVEKRTRELALVTEELQSSHDELVRSQAKAGLAAMVASVSHELGTPIGNSVLVSSTFSDLATQLKRQLDDNQLRKSSLQQLQSTLSEGSAMLQQNLERAEVLLRNFKQVSADQASEQRRKFDVSEVIGEVVNSMAPSLRKSPHTVVQNIPAGIIVNSLPGPLGQVIINLINNAYLHAFAGRTDGVVHIHGELRDGDVLIQVKDNGAGMSPEVQQRMFEPFFSTRIGDGGTGLGMSIVQGIVTKTLGGTLQVHSELGQGTRFDITLPREAPGYQE